MDLAVIRQFCLYRRRRDPTAFVPGRAWAPQSTESTFLAHIFSRAEIRLLLHRCGRPAGSTCPPPVVRMLLLILYCTGIRFGEAVRLTIGDVERGVFFVESKGRSRWVPFHRSLERELRRYLRSRRKWGSVNSSARLLVEEDGRPMTVRRASDVIRWLLRAIGLKPASGRVGPRPYDLRHAFAVHRLEHWYRAGVDVQARLAWLSAYMGHVDVFGTERYLHATPALLSLASRRLHRMLVGE
jgi:integrase/recombinase XerD